MKNRRSIFIAALALFTSCLLFTACGNKEGASDSSASDSSQSSDSSESTSGESGSSESSSEPAIPPVIMKVYDSETKKYTDTSVELTPDGNLNATILAELNKKYAFEAGTDKFEIDFNEVRVEEDGIHVDFKTGSLPSTGMGSEEEGDCLSSIASTFLANYPNAEKVFFTINHLEYTSGHYMIPVGEAFGENVTK